jgi:Na+-translocating ferredoxin:NAD+ oxidoreductase subunit D
MMENKVQAAPKAKPKFVRTSAPYIRDPKSSLRRIMYDVIIALLPVVAFSFYRLGLLAVSYVVVALISMVGTEFLFYYIRKERFTLDNGTAIISALIYAMILPENTPLWVIAIGGVIGIFVSKLAFGGLGANIFNIAGFARVFVGLSFGGWLSYTRFTDALSGATVLGVLNQNTNVAAVNNVDLWTMFSGIGMPGSVGETSALLILIGGLYMLIRRSFDWRIPFTYITTFAFLALVAAVASGADLMYVPIQVFSGGMMFGAIYMATDPVSAPTTLPGKIYYAFGIGTVNFLIRLFGALPEGTVFAIVIMNMFVPMIDYYRWAKPKFTLRSAGLFAVVIAVVSGIIVLGVS